MKKNYYENIQYILNDGEIEGIPLKNVSILKKIFSDKSINKLLYKGFKNNYENEYGDSFDYLFMKVEDMVYRIFLLVNYSICDKYGITDENVIKDTIYNLLKNNDISFYDAVSYDDYDLEIIRDHDSEIRELLSVKKI